MRGGAGRVPRDRDDRRPVDAIAAHLEVEVSRVPRWPLAASLGVLDDKAGDGVVGPEVHLQPLGLTARAPLVAITT